MPNKAKKSTAAKKPNKAATVIKVTLLILLVLVITAAAVFGIYYLTGGFGGRYSTFVVQINGKPVISSGSVSLPRGSEIKVTGFSDYSLEVVAAEPEEDFEVTVGEDTLLYSDLAGEDMTAGFTFTEAEECVQKGNLKIISRQISHFQYQLHEKGAHLRSLFRQLKFR